jgi:hypothetical protein
MGAKWRRPLRTSFLAGGKLKVLEWRWLENSKVSVAGSVGTLWISFLLLEAKAPLITFQIRLE